jgi:hypothetical protein
VSVSITFELCSAGVLLEVKMGDTREDASEITGSVTRVTFDSEITRGDEGRAATPPAEFRGGLEDDTRVAGLTGAGKAEAGTAVADLYLGVTDILVLLITTGGLLPLTTGAGVAGAGVAGVETTGAGVAGAETTGVGTAGVETAGAGVAGAGTAGVETAGAGVVLCVVGVCWGDIEITGGNAGRTVAARRIGVI